MESELLKSVVSFLGPWGSLALLVLGTLVVIGQVVVGLTATKADDLVMQKIFDLPLIGGFVKAIASFAPIQKKD